VIHRSAAHVEDAEPPGDRRPRRRHQASICWRCVRHVAARRRWPWCNPLLVEVVADTAPSPPPCPGARSNGMPPRPWG